MMGSWNAGNLFFPRQDTESMFTGVDFNSWKSRVMEF
jgi:hypothetical protein